MLPTYIFYYARLRYTEVLSRAEHNANITERPGLGGSAPAVATFVSPSSLLFVLCTLYLCVQCSDSCLNLVDDTHWVGLLYFLVCVCVCVCEDERTKGREDGVLG